MAGLSDSDLIKLYSGRILALAADIPHLGRLDNPDGTASRRSPLCGSTVTADLSVTDGRITRFAQDVKACALGQASAAVLGSVVVGLTEDDLDRAHRALVAMLTDRGPPPPAPFQDYDVLIPARDYKNRHASILLALEAAREAMADARRKAAG
ncbi:MAG: iron-sulfur cluster assembly scaffold protein [Pseudomonadota bacterium]